MHISDIVRRSGRSLRSAKARTILTALAIAVGGFTLTATLAAGNGIRDYTDQLVASNFDPAELLVGRDPEVASSGTPSEDPKEYDESISSVSFGPGGQGGLQLKQVTDEDVEELRALPYVEQVRENYSLRLRYITMEGQKRFTASAETFNPAQKPELAAGTLNSDGSISKGSIILPENYVKVFNLDNAAAAVGKKITINIQKQFSQADTDAVLDAVRRGVDPSTLSEVNDESITYTVAAVSKKAATSISFGALPILFSGEDARDIYDYTTKGAADYQRYFYVNVRVKDGADDTILRSAQDDLKAKEFYTQSSKDIQKSITQVVNILQVLVGVFGLITLTASVFGIVNTQYISVLERTREIGLMKALGMRSRDIRRLFMLEAGWIGFLGGFIGAAVAMLVGIPLNPWISDKLDLGEGNSLLIYRPAQMIALIVVLIVIAMVAGFLPARKAAKLDPIEALRTE
jgi:putative ABC transport system permease protein